MAFNKMGWPQSQRCVQKVLYTYNSMWGGSMGEMEFIESSPSHVLRMMSGDYVYCFHFSQTGGLGVVG